MIQPIKEVMEEKIEAVLGPCDGDTKMKVVIVMSMTFTALVGHKPNQVELSKLVADVFKLSSEEQKSLEEYFLK